MLVRVPKQESVSLVTTRGIVLAVTLESGLVLAEYPITPILVETRQRDNIHPIIMALISRGWDISSCSEAEILVHSSNGLDKVKCRFCNIKCRASCDKCRLESRKIGMTVAKVL